MFLMNMARDSLSGDIPESAFFMFQMTFAIITPALIVGAYPERIKFSFVISFSFLWILFVYAPVTHWIWGGGWLAEMGVLDFAGGLVVHLTAGTTALILAFLLGPREGFPNQIKKFLPPPDEKNKKTNSFGNSFGVFWEGFGGYLDVFLGGFWRVFVGVFEKFLGVI